MGQTNVSVEKNELTKLPKVGKHLQAEFKDGIVDRSNGRGFVELNHKEKKRQKVLRSKHGYSQVKDECELRTKKAGRNKRHPEGNRKSTLSIAPGQGVNGIGTQLTE